MKNKKIFKVYETTLYGKIFSRPLYMLEANPKNIAAFLIKCAKNNYKVLNEKDECVIEVLGNGSFLINDFDLSDEIKDFILLMHYGKLEVPNPKYKLV